MGWIIKSGVSQFPAYLCGNPMIDWTYDADRAVRFLRKEDAEQMIKANNLTAVAEPYNGI